MVWDTLVSQIRSAVPADSKLIRACRLAHLGFYPRETGTQSVSDVSYSNIHQINYCANCSVQEEAHFAVPCLSSLYDLGIRKDSE